MVTRGKRDRPSPSPPSPSSPCLLLPRSVHPRRLEPAAAAVGGDDEVQGGVLRVAALFDEILRRLLARADLDELLLVLGLVFAEVGAEPALAVVYLEHIDTPFVHFASRLDAVHLLIDTGWRCKHSSNANS